MAKPMKTAAAVTAGLTLLFSILAGMTALPVFLSLAITAGTFFYHLAMRLAVGGLFSARMGSLIDCTRPWFQPRRWEPALYRALRVRRWKKYLPTYAPGSFDPKAHSLGELVQATCRAELVHEVILPLSFLPLLAVPWAGAFPVFLLTSLLAAGFDLLFVILQRYNRPRLSRLRQRRGE